MPTPSAEIISVLSVFAAAFTVAIFAKSLTLRYGSIMAPGRRALTAARKPANGDTQYQNQGLLREAMDDLLVKYGVDEIECWA